MIKLDECKSKTEEEEGINLEFWAIFTEEEKIHFKSLEKVIKEILWYEHKNEVYEQNQNEMCKKKCRQRKKCVKLKMKVEAGW